MRFNFHTWLAVTFSFLAITLLPIKLSGHEIAPPLSAKFAAVPPCPALVAAAQAGHIPLDRIDPPTNTDVLNPGDSITALVTHCEKGKHRAQWIVYLQVAVPDPAEIPAKAPKPLTVYTSFGNKLEFISSPSIVTVRTLGPFVEPDARRKPPAVQDKSARFSLDKGFLGLGLDQAAAASYRVHLLAKDLKSKGNMAFGPKPFSPAQVEEGHKLVAAFRITPEEERAWTGACPALISYLTIVQQTPGLAQILFKVLELPSVWSLLRQGGVKDINIELQPDLIAPSDAAAWGLPKGSPVYRMPNAIEINHHPALELTLIVTAPHPPLLACGGIVGFLAENPVDKENYLTLRVVSAQHGAAIANKTSEEPPPTAIADAKAPWGRIVMVGASVTAGFTVSEPLGGDKTAQYDLSRYVGAALLMPHEPLRNLGNAMFFMQPESAGKLQIDQALKSKPTLVTGLDFMFWFCYGAGCKDGERLQRFEKGLKLLETVPCPLILGDIPDATAATNILGPDEIPSAQVLSAANRRLKEWAATRPRVVIVPLSEFMRAAACNAACTIHKVTLPKGKTRALLQDDQLHPTPRGCAVLALALLDAFQSTRTAPSANEICWDPQEVFRRVMKNNTF